MSFFLAFSIFGLAAVIITTKTLVGYTTLKWWVKLGVLFLTTFFWFGNRGLWYIRQYNWLSTSQFDVISYIAYLGLGFAFILVSLLLIRDFLWFAGYSLAKLFKVKCNEKYNPNNNHSLNVANIITLILAIIFTGYGMYEAYKLPEVKSITIQDKKILKPIKIVQINDLHINRKTPITKIDQLVERINSLNADVIVLVGDVVDGRPQKIEAQMQALTKLKAKYGTYSVLGNHEFYSGLLPWLKHYVKLKLGPLYNSGVTIDNNIHIAGIPDKSIHDMKSFGTIDMEQALARNKSNLYSILLAHTPNFSEEKLKGVDLQLSGHTHGGQIFPFHHIVKTTNKYLSGLYQEDGYKIYVSRGVGYWGPPIRLFAPSEITLINLEPEK